MKCKRKLLFADHTASSSLSQDYEPWPLTKRKKIEPSQLETANQKIEYLSHQNKRLKKAIIKRREQTKKERKAQIKESLSYLKQIYELQNTLYLIVHKEHLQQAPQDNAPQQQVGGGGSLNGNVTGTIPSTDYSVANNCEQTIAFPPSTNADLDGNRNTNQDPNNELSSPHANQSVLQQEELNSEELDNQISNELEEEIRNLSSKENLKIWNHKLKNDGVVVKCTKNIKKQYLCRDCKKCYTRRGDRDNHEELLNHIKWKKGRFFALDFIEDKSKN